eukprot:tig00020553_g10761.t1
MYLAICGFGPVGQTVGRLLTESQRAWVAVEIDPDVVRSAQESGLPVLFGDACRPQVFAAAGVKRPAAVVVTMRSYKRTLRLCIALRSAYPTLAIFVRARTRRQQRELEAAGATTWCGSRLAGAGARGRGRGRALARGRAGRGARPRQADMRNPASVPAKLLEGSLQLGGAVLEADGADPALVAGVLAARREQEGLLSRSPRVRPPLPSLL